MSTEFVRLVVGRFMFDGNALFVMAGPSRSKNGIASLARRAGAFVRA